MIFIFTFILVAVLESSHPSKAKNCKSNDREKAEQLKDDPGEK